MNESEIIEQTRAFIEEKFSVEGSGHDYWHMYRVWQLAKRIATREKSVDVFTLELAALLHDIADWKFHDGDDEAGPRAARKWLESLNVNNAIIEHVEHIIRNVSFKGANVETKLKTAEGQIVYDADKLDAMGAIGIGRTFAFGGTVGRAMYDPNWEVENHATYDAYKKAIQNPTLNHFHEKLLLLKDRMLTRTGKELAQHRHEVMEEFLKEFLAEWEGKH